MRIAIFEPKYFTPSPNAGTSLIFLKELASEFARSGQEVFVLTEGSTTGKRMLAKNLEVANIRGLFSPYSDTFSPTHQVIPYFSDFFSPDLPINVIKTLRNEIKADVLFTCSGPIYTAFTAFIGRMTGIPTVHYLSHYTSSQRWWRRDVETMVGYKIPSGYSIRQIVMDATREILKLFIPERWGLGNVDCLIVSSKYVADNVVKGGNLCNNLQIVYPGIKVPTLNETAEPVDKPTITYFGHFWQGRGVLDLAHAFCTVSKNNKEARLIIAPSNIHELTRSLFNKIVENVDTSRIIWRGRVNNIYQDILSASNVVVLPYRDIPSVKLLETMAAGKAIVTTDIGWSKEVIENGRNGFLVKVGDADEMARKIELLLNDKYLARSMGKAAHNTIAEGFSIERSAHKIIKILEGM